MPREDESIERLAALIDDQGQLVESAERGQEQEPEPEAEGEPREAEGGTPEKEEADEKPADEPKVVSETVELEWNGRRYSVPVELKDGFMMQADYTRKTQELAAQRKAEEERGRSAIESAVKEATTAYQQELETYRKLALQAAPQRPDAKLLHEDPLKYLEQKELFEEWQRAESDRLAKEQWHFQERLVKEEEQLIAKLPDWKDSKVRAADTQRIVGLLQSVGLSREQLGAFNENHQLILLAKELLDYRDLKANTEKAVKKIQALPPKVERPGVPHASEKSSARDIIARAKRTGREDDAVAAIEALL